MLSVFPAPAGINRQNPRLDKYRRGVPRASGDKPVCYANIFILL
ncbi:hypothetical protein LJ08_3431 [Escherichia coli]|nr:hypothetical protein LJ08_3431 [Escherichia coli]